MSTDSIKFLSKHRFSLLTLRSIAARLKLEHRHSEIKEEGYLQRGVNPKSGTRETIP